MLGRYTASIAAAVFMLRNRSCPRQTLGFVSFFDTSYVHSLKNTTVLILIPGYFSGEKHGECAVVHYGSRVLPLGRSSHLGVRKCTQIGKCAHKQVVDTQTSNFSS